MDTCRLREFPLKSRILGSSRSCPPLLVSVVTTPFVIKDNGRRKGDKEQNEEREKGKEITREMQRGDRKGRWEG